MPFFALVILALIQGITEFLPVSSSGHLVLAGRVFDHSVLSLWEQHLLINVAVHVGTLFSVLIYFRQDVAAMIRGVPGFFKADFADQGARLNLHILIASIPVIGAGLVLHILQPGWLLMVEIVAWTTLIFGILLWVADAVERQDRTLADMTWRHAFLIGLSQMLALVPGTSRSGITMTASRFLGYTRTEAAHFSLLLSIIAIAGAGTLGALDLAKAGNLDITVEVLLAALIAFLSGWAAIAAMMRWLAFASFKVFAIYRIILGSVLLALFYGILG